MQTKVKLLAATAITLLPSLAYAAPTDETTKGWGTPTTNAPTGSPTNFETMVTGAINWILGFVGLVAVLMIIWGGFQYLTSAGNQDQARSGKDTIKFALMGLVVAGIAYALVNVIVGTILKA